MDNVGKDVMLIMAETVENLHSRVRQLERDIEYLLAADAANKTRFATMDDKQRRLEAQKMYGIR